MKKLKVVLVIVYAALLCLASYEMGQRHAAEKYWQGWHEGKAAQFEADQAAVVDGEGVSQ